TESAKPSSLSWTVLRLSRPVRLVRKVLRKILNIQARKFVPSWKLARAFSALAKVSCTRSRASSASRHIQRAKLYSGSSKGSASFSNSFWFTPLTSLQNEFRGYDCSPVAGAAYGLPVISALHRLVHHNDGRHLWMQRAEVLIRSRLAEGVAEAVVRIQRL